MQAPATGWHHIANDVYHSKTFDAVGASMLQECMRSPAHGKAKQAKTEDNEMSLGSLFHASILEPEIFARCKVPDQYDGRTNEGKRQILDFVNSLVPGDIVVLNSTGTKLSQDIPEWIKKAKLADYNTAREMSDAAWKCPVFKSLFSNGIAEQTGIYRDNSGVNFKIKPDYRRSDIKIISDIKTTDDARLEHGFDFQIKRMHYDMRAAWYLHVANLIDGPGSYDKFVWVACETTPPYARKYYEVHETWITRGTTQWQLGLKEYLEAEKTAGGWDKGYPAEITMAVAPAHAQF